MATLTVHFKQGIGQLGGATSQTITVEETSEQDVLNRSKKIKNEGAIFRSSDVGRVYVPGDKIDCITFNFVRGQVS